MNFYNRIIVLLIVFVGLCRGDCQEAGYICICEDLVASSVEPFSLNSSVFYECDTMLIWNSYFEFIPKNVFTLSRYTRKLTLGRNNITVVRGDDFRHIGAIEDLNLDANDIDYLPPDLFKYFTNVTKLSIAYNRITRLDTVVFGALTNIKSLSFAGNKIKVIPPGIFSQLQKLENLDLGKNEIEFLDDHTFEGNLNLKVLDLQGNNLKVFTSSLFLAELPNLTTLTLSGNDVQRIENGTFQFNQKLQELIIARANVSYMDSGAFMNLRNLTVLDLSFNNLDTIEVDQLTHIELIDIRGNKLIDIAYDKLYTKTGPFHVLLRHNLWSCAFVQRFRNFTTVHNIAWLRYLQLTDDRDALQKDCKKLE